MLYQYNHNAVPTAFCVFSPKIPLRRGQGGGFADLKSGATRTAAFREQ